LFGKFGYVFSLPSCFKVRPSEEVDKKNAFVLATGDALYDFAVSTPGETLEMWTDAIEGQRKKLFTVVNENFKRERKETSVVASTVLRAPVRKLPVEGERLSGAVLVDVLDGAEWPARFFDLGEGFLYVKQSEAETKSLLRLNMGRFVHLDLVVGPPSLGKCISVTIDGEDILFCPGTNHDYWATGFALQLKKYKPDAYAKFCEFTQPKPAPRSLTAAPPVMPFAVGDNVYAVFIDDSLW
jgi:hypothetical protein